MKVKADFTDLLREASKVSKESGALFSKGLESGLGRFSSIYRKNLQKLDEFQRRVDTQRTEYNKRKSIQAEKDLAAFRLKKNEEIDKAEKKRLKAAAAGNSKREKELQRQIDQNRELVELADEYQTDSAKFNDNMESAARAIEKITRETRSQLKSLDSAADTAKEIRESFKGLTDVTKLSDNLSGLAETVGDSFKEGINVEGLARTFGQSSGKWLSKGLSAAGGGGAGITAVAGVVGGLVAAMGVLLAAFISVDKKVKEFNKDVIRSHGALTVMNLGAGNLNRGLTIMKRTVMDLQGNLGVTEEEAKQLFTALDNGNITLARITGGTTDAAEAQRRLSAALRDTYTAANQTGVGLSEYADNLTNYVNDLGMSTETVNDNFRSIAKMASESGFSTRRFYSMVVQATSGQSALNVRLGQTGDLLLRMSKIMGMKKAADMVGGAANGMGQMSAQDRIKTLLVAGRRGERVFQRQALQSAGNFSQSNRGLSSAFTAALERAGLTSSGIGDAFSSSNPENLVQALGRLGVRDQRAMLTELRQSGVEGTEGMARQLEELTNLSRRGLGARVGSGGALGAGSNLAMTAATLRTFMDPTGRLSAPQRVAAENVTNMSGQAMDSFLSEMQALQGEFESMQGNGSTGTALREKYGLSFDDAGKLVDRLGHVIENGDDLFATQTAQDAHEEAKLRDEATEVAYQTMDATVSVADILENKVARYIQQLYEWASGWLGPLLLKLPGLGEEREDFENKRKTTSAIETKIEELTKQNSAAREQMAHLRVQAGSETDPVKREQVKAALEQLKQQQQQRELQAQALRDASGRISSGNTYDTRTGGEGDARLSTLLGGQTPTQVAQARVTAEGLRGRGFSEAEINRNAQEEAARMTQRQAEITARDRGTPIPTPARAPAASTAAPAPAAAAPPPPAHVEAAAAPVVAATESAQEQQTRQHQQDTRLAQNRDRQNRVLSEKLLRGKDLGDGLAMSRLPDAIAEAGLKLRLTEDLLKKGKTPAEVASLLGTGAVEDSVIAGTGDSQYGIRALRGRTAAMAHDFVYQDRGGSSVITPIDRQDQVVGMKTGGPIASAGAGGGGNVHINIHGGDERRVFEVVRRAIRQAGITPNRVTT